MTSSVKDYLITDGLINMSKAEWTGKIVFTPNQYKYMTSQSSSCKYTFDSFDISTIWI